MSQAELERAGFAAWRAAEDLRSLRLSSMPEDGDHLAQRLRELEEDARMVAGEIAMRLREGTGE